MQSYLLHGKSFKSFCLSLFAANILFISPIAADESQKGNEIYEINCQGCHMADGKGEQSMGFPALIKSPKVSSLTTALDVVANGFNEMPAFKEYLTDEEIVKVVNHIRNNFGNRFNDIAIAADIPR
ncbi:MAG: cytochrome c [Campylobacteraceae bacterium]|jgi:mono/diheme cytochrome c family protein|nr:cytochrome c [Campylobacteraceae bacterium]